VEWNISTIGHSPLSTEPFHVVRVDGPGDVPVLRMYEFERLRGTPFQLDAYLPDGSDYLFVHVRIRNPNPVEVPIYWWTNIAVPELAETRVIASANDAFRFSYDGSLTRVTMPVVSGVDASYPARGAHSIDYFFDVPPEQRPWIAALDASGHGLVHASTARLRGRKLFIWGQGAGGQSWQRFLSEPGHPYFEIQAGLAQTQLEHLAMPGDDSWSWLEAFGPIQVDAAAAHGTWSIARGAVDRRLARELPQARLQAVETDLAELVDAAAAEVTQAGTGWGALERHRRQSNGEPPLNTAGMPFPDSSLGPDQAPWLALLEEGALPTISPADAPPSDVVGEAWRSLIEASPVSWLMQLQLGIARFASGDRAGARAALEGSLRDAESAWALRHLAVLDRLEGEVEAAAERLARADQIRPGIRALIIELVEALIDAGRASDALIRIEALEDHDRDGRIRLLELQAALEVEDLDRADAIFASKLVVPDLREGDLIFEDLWVKLQLLRLARREGIPVDRSRREWVLRKHPIPSEYDFRMSP
jgi:hypothetical protein